MLYSPNSLFSTYPAEIQTKFWDTFNALANVAIGLLIVLRIAEFVNAGATGAAPSVP